MLDLHKEYSLMNNKIPSSNTKLEQYSLWRILRHTFQMMKWIALSTIVSFIMGGIGLLYLKSKPLPTPDLSSTTKIYDDQGHVIDQIDKGKSREYMRLSETPRYLILATLAAEDETFYSHFGFSLKGILRATIANIRSGEIKQGASTITQQLARNLYLSHDRTWTRKLKEAIYALQLELHYSKDEILEMYLNGIYYGNGAYGTKRAAKVYFNKALHQLNLAECAFLAGLPRGPSYYSPYQHLERAIERQHHILHLMVKDRMITQAEADRAKETKITIAPLSEPTQVHANYFRDFIIQSTMKHFGLDESLVHLGGLNIYTTLNSELQKNAEQIVANQLQNHPLQAALISVDPHTGHIKAFVGGKDYKQSQFNRVFAKRQPGSTFKPILYLSALEHGFTPTTSIVSQPTSFFYQGERYQPKNFQNQYAYRPITMREAIARSDNIYAVTTQLQIGIPQIIDMAKRLGITSKLRATPSLALGSYSITPFELTQAYATIASGGIRRDLTGIVKITDSQGNIIVENKPKGEQVALTSHTFVLTQMLKSVLEPGGTAYRAGLILDFPAVGKTGSTDWDGWIVGYTPDLVTTVWVGYDQGKKIAHHETKKAQYIWANYMKKALTRTKNHRFKVPKGVRGVYIDPKTGYLSTPFCKHSRLEYFVAGTEPTSYCPLHPTPKSLTEEDSWWDRIWNWWEQSIGHQNGEPD